MGLGRLHKVTNKKFKGRIRKWENGEWPLKMGIHVDRLATLHLWSFFIRGRANKYFVLILVYNLLNTNISMCTHHLKATYGFFNSYFILKFSFRINSLISWRELSPSFCLISAPFQSQLICVCVCTHGYFMHHVLSHQCLIWNVPNMNIIFIYLVRRINEKYKKKIDIVMYS